MKNKIKELITEYKQRCDEILESSGATIDEHGDPIFDYNCDYDDQLYSMEYETEYYTLVGVIADLEMLLEG